MYVFFDPCKISAFYEKIFNRAEGLTWYLLLLFFFGYKEGCTSFLTHAKSLLSMRKYLTGKKVSYDICCHCSSLGIKKVCTSFVSHAKSLLSIKNYLAGQNVWHDICCHCSSLGIKSVYVFCDTCKISLRKYLTRQNV